MKKKLKIMPIKINKLIKCLKKINFINFIRELGKFNINNFNINDIILYEVFTLYIK